MVWPTALNDEDKAPTIMELLGSDDAPLARQAGYLVQAGARLKDEGHQPEVVQLPLVGNGVRLTVPMVLADRRGNKALVFTQAEAWTMQRIEQLRAWIEDVRKAGIPAQVPVLVVSQHDSPDVAEVPGVMQFIPLPLKVPGDPV
jgi:hypothetical protein